MIFAAEIMSDTGWIALGVIILGVLGFMGICINGVAEIITDLSKFIKRWFAGD